MPAWLKEPYRNAAEDAGSDSRREASTAKRDGMPVHLLDIHLEKGMHCVDCHFVQDAHGNTQAAAAKCGPAIEIQCIDCHGTSTAARRRCTTTGPAAYTSGPDGGRDLTALRTPSGSRRFERRRRQDLSRTRWSRPNLRWEVVQTLDTIDPRQRALQRQVAPGQDRPRSTTDGKLAWGDMPATANAPITNEQHELHRLPLVVEPELLRLPPAAEGQQEDAAACTTKAT